MSNIDLDKYFASKVNKVDITQKMADLNLAAEQKITRLNSQYQASLANEPNRIAELEAAQKSWVGLDTSGPINALTNLGAQLLSGATHVGGLVGSLPFNANAINDEAQVTEDQRNAYSTYQQLKSTGQSIPADLEAKLNQKIALPVTVASAKAQFGPNMVAPTVKDILDRAQGARQYGQQVMDVADTSSIVNKTKVNEFSKDIVKDFDPAWHQITNAIERGNGERRSIPERAADIATGLGSILAGAGSAIVNNKQAVLELITNNLPQVGVGAMGASGMGILTASNVGYAADEYQKGVLEYQKKNNGALPPEELRNKMAVQAAGLALAEHIGDISVLGAGKLLGSTDVAKEAAKAGFKQSILNVGKATATAGLMEGITEGTQTYLEGEIQQKPAWARDIFGAAVMGAAAGGGISGGARGLQELAEATPEQIEASKSKAEKKQEADAAFQAAAEANDPAPYLDPKSESYSPEKAVGVLLQHASKTEATDEVRQANLTKVNEIVEGIKADLQKVQATYNSVSKDGLEANKKRVSEFQKELEATDPQDTARITELTEAINTFQGLIDDFKVDSKAARLAQAAIYRTEISLDKAKKLQDELVAVVNPTVEVDSTLELIDTVVDKNDTTAVEKYNKSVENIINLSMVSPESVNPLTAKKIADNKNNSLNDAQRAQLRTFSDAQVEANKLKDAGAVSQEVYFGSPPKSQRKYIGIAEYRKNIGKALQAGRKADAEKQLGMLEKFAQDHQAKADLAATLKKGEQIIRTKDGEWGKSPVKLTDAEVAKLGGWTMNSSATVKGMLQEAKALQAATVEMKSAIALKFGVSSLTSAVSQDVSLNKSTPEDVEPLPRLDPTDQTSPLATQVPSNKEENKESPSVENSPVNVASPSSKPSVVAVADAPADTVSSSAPTTKTQEETKQEAKTEAVAAKQQDERSESQAAEAAKPYVERNLIKAHFKQEPGNDENTKRPLVVVQDFMSKVVTGLDEIKPFLKESTLSEKQEKVLKTFMVKAANWQAMITKNLFKGTSFTKAEDPAYRYQDMMQFLLNDQGDLDQNTKTAISLAVFTWIAENANKGVFNTDEEINLILGRDSDTPISPEENKVLRRVGTRQTVVINSLGQKIVQALGFKELDNTPLNERAKLEGALGAHAFKLMLDLGLVEVNQVSNNEMNTLFGNETTENNDSSTEFVLVKRNEGELNPLAAEIAEVSKGTGSVLQKLFSVESGLKEPVFKPVPMKQIYARNSEQKVPKKLAQIIAEKQKTPHFIREDKWQVLGQLSDDIALKIFGFKDPATAHISNRDSVEAKNEGIQREYERARDFITGSMENLTDPIYFEHSIWNNQRVGIVSNTVNPQTSKIHRFMLYQKSWETQVKMDDTNNFMLRVAEGLGIKTDKKANDKALEEVKKLAQTPVIQEAVKALQRALTEGGINKTEQEAILAGVTAGKEKAHSLDALTALAQMEIAKANNQSEFTVQMMAEVDGVTNGPMLSTLFMGAANSVDQLFKTLNKGGFYRKNEGTNYNLWRDDPRNQDLYESTTRSVVSRINNAIKQGVKPEVFNAIYTFTGPLTNADNSVSSAGRNIVKTPLTALVFGSSVENSVDSMADKFIEAIYTKIEDVAQGNGSVEEIHSALKVLGFNADKYSIDQLMNDEFSSADVKMFKKQFKQTVGAAVEESLNSIFDSFIKRRAEFNKTAGLSFKLFNTVYEGIRKEYINELVKEGKIAVNSKGQPIHDLTKKQENELKKKLKAVTPLMHTYMSKANNDLDAGLLISKNDRKISNEKMYSGEVKFGTPLNNVKFSTYKKSSVPQRSINTHGYTRVYTKPGVKMAPVSVHASDSAISHIAAAMQEVLNIHDAHGAGLGTIAQAAKNLNKATWEVMMNYSPATEMADAYIRMLEGINQMLENKELPDDVITELKQTLTQKVLVSKAKEAKELAYSADSMKLEAMSQMTSIDQYAFEGGNYEVTDTDRQAAKDKLNSLENTLNQKEQDLISSLINKLHGSVKTEVSKEQVKDTAWGKVGKSDVDSETKLVEFFKNKPVMTAKEVITHLMLDTSNKFNFTILRALDRLNLDVKVRYVTPNTLTSEILEAPMENSRGWYVSNTQGQEVYLMGEGFVHSGLTTETVIHELLHAAVARVIAKPTGDAIELVRELETIRTKAAVFIKEKGLNKFDAAVSNVHELVSWGMSNRDFQAEVLTQFEVESLTKSNRLVSAMKKFIDTLSQYLFKKPTENQNKALATLVSNVSGLFKAASEVDNQVNVNTSQASIDPADTVFNYTTVDIYDALNQGKPTVSAEFDTHLRTLLDSMVTKLYGPFGSLRQTLLAQAPKNALDAYSQAMASGKMPFAAQALSGNFKISEQEAFVIEQVEAVVRASIDANDGQSAVAYRELTKLYNEVQAKLKPQDFYEGDWATATNHEKAQAENLYDFVFKMSPGKDNRMDYLSRFAALGLGHEGFAKLLKFDTALAPITNPNESFGKRLAKIFDKMLGWFAGKLTHTYAGQQADEKLMNLAQQLVSVEARKQATLADKARATDFLEPMEKAAQGLSNAARKRLVQFSGLPFFKTNSNPFIRLGANVVNTYAADRVELLVEGLNKLYNQNIGKQHNMAIAAVNEMRGGHEGNVQFHFLHRATKHLENERKSLITNVSQFVRESFAEAGEYLKDHHKTALTKVLLRTDVSSLLGDYDMKDIQKLLEDRQYVDAEIKKIEQQLKASKFSTFFINQAKGLGYRMVTGEIRNAHQLMNAHNIARLSGTKGTRFINETTSQEFEPTIDKLISLYGLKYSDTIQLKRAAEVLNIENSRTDNGNGVEMVLKSHLAFQNFAKDKLFKGSEALFMKGYVPEVYDPYMSVVVAEEGNTELEAMGYQMNFDLTPDEADPDKGIKKQLWTRRDGGLMPYQSGIFSTKGMKAKGTRMHSGSTNVNTFVGTLNASNMAQVRAQKDPEITALFTDANYDPTVVKNAYMAPVMNPFGDVVNYRYMMHESTKDALLDRDNRFDKLLGAYAGSNFDKLSSVEQNKKAIKALYDQYEQEFSKDPSAYMEVGPLSKDPELREIYRMMPEHTRQEIRRVWGKDKMMVRADLLDLNFGYRKLSITDAFDKEDSERDRFDKAFVQLMQGLMGDKARLRLRTMEDIWQTFVKEAKNNVVTKSITTLFGNFRSNASELLLFGVNPAAIVHHHRVALREALKYRKDTKELAALKLQLATDYIKGNKVEMERRVLQLENDIARNAVKPLIDAGLMPTIVEDIAEDDDQYSYKSKIAEKYEGFVDKLNPAVVTTAKTFYMVKDTPVMEAMSYGTQISDFMARYTLYQHMTTRKKNPMNHAEAIQLASEAFVNYDLPTHRRIQQFNDIGLMFFTKYYMRIQKIIARLYRDSPGRVMMMIAFEKLISNQPTVLDSSMLVRFGNPLDEGAFMYPESISELTTVKLLASPF